MKTIAMNRNPSFQNLDCIAAISGRRFHLPVFLLLPFGAI